MIKLKFSNPFTNVTRIITINFINNNTIIKDKFYNTDTHIIPDSNKNNFLNKIYNVGLKLLIQDGLDKLK
jgi:hypothetical protein